MSTLALSLIHCPFSRGGVLSTDLRPHDRYALSFTYGGLLVREAGVVIAEYLVSREWTTVRERVTTQNLLQARTQSSSVRSTRETIQRVGTLDDHELELFIDGGLTERGHLMWAATCRRYGMIGDFAQEVVRERWLLMTPTLSTEHFDRFLIGKSLWHPELDELRPSTRKKLRQNVFRMLQDAGLLTASGSIVPAVMSERVIRTLNGRTPSDIRFFPTTTSAGAEQ